MKEYLYRCDECKAILSNPTNPKESQAHLNLKNIEMYFSYFSKSVNDWKQEKFVFPCQEHHFCNGKCAGRFVDKKVGEITAKIKEV